MASKRQSRLPGDGPAFRCRECGWSCPKWVGRCGECQAWGTVEESGSAAVATALARASAAGPSRTPAVPIAQVRAGNAQRRSTGIAELDRVLGDGLVSDAVVLLAGEPGVGKSTLLLHMAAGLARQGRTVLYITGEESTGQVRLRAGRMGALADTLYLAAENDLASVLGQIEAVDPDVFIVDSVQTVSSDAVEGFAGGVSQVRTVTAVLTQVAKAKGKAGVLVGHVTKEGAVAGPRTLEHIVDVVLTFEGDRHSGLRILRAVKNRFGAVDEVGCFAMTETGIEEIPDPSGVFLTDRATPASGTAVTVTMEGRRPLLAEVQALVMSDGPPTARRTTSGLDANRVALIAAVLDRRAQVGIGPVDLFAATVGGVRITEPASDLAIALALATAAAESPAPLGLVAIGEVGLAGDIRSVPAVPRRLREAARLGFTCALIPAAGTAGDAAVGGIETIRVSTVGEALGAMGSLHARSSAAVGGGQRKRRGVEGPSAGAGPMDGAVVRLGTRAVGEQRGR